MIDLLYLAITGAYFALMLAFVRVCERLGRRAVERLEESA